MKSSRVFAYLAVTPLCVAAVSGCSLLSKDTRLNEALDRVAATDTTITHLAFDDTAALTELTGTDWSTGQDKPGWGQLRGMGSEAVVSYGQILSDETGIDIMGADYGIAAGKAPERVALLAGGQDGDAVTGKLTSLGWSSEEDRLVSSGDISDSEFTVHLGQVKPDDTDVVYGDLDADLSVMSGSGDVLGDDDRIAEAAECLGDVVAAIIETPQLDSGHPVVALGVRAPETAQDTPRAVACVSWEDTDQTQEYTERVQTALAESTVPSNQRPYSELLTDAEISDADGTLAHWEADTDAAMGIFSMWAQGEIPGMLTSCDGLPPQALEQYPDWC